MVWIGYDPPRAGADGRRPVPGVIRLSGTREHVYRTEPFANGYAGLLFHGQSGKIWLNDATGWSYWDARSDRFLAGEPWEDFAIRAGPLMLSMACGRGQAGAPTARELQSGLRRKEGEKWVAMLDPLGKAEVFGAAAMAWKDRILLTSRQLGVLEYDISNDRWALLHSYGGFTAFFDAAGRRILAGDEYVLAYLGDPFRPAPGEEADVEEFDNLLARMEDESFRVREQATAEMIRLARKHAVRLRRRCGEKEYRRSCGSGSNGSSRNPPSPAATTTASASSTACTRRRRSRLCSCRRLDDPPPLAAHNDSAGDSAREGGRSQ